MQTVEPNVVRQFFEGPHRLLDATQDVDLGFRQLRHSLQQGFGGRAERRDVGILPANGQTTVSGDQGNAQHCQEARNNGSSISDKPETWKICRWLAAFSRRCCNNAGRPWMASSRHRPTEPDRAP